MKISIIVATSQNLAIGNNGKLPWHLADDLKHFKQTTLKKPIIMGRKTFESIGRPLPQRQNIVISRTTTEIAGCQVFSSLEHAISAAIAAVNTANEIMIIGGSEIYKSALPIANRIYLTKVQCTVKGDAFFPHIDMSEWQVISHENFQKSSSNDHPFESMILDKIVT
jgi:dihydrofolate reductase